MRQKINFWTTYLPHCFTEKSIGLLFPKSNFNGNMLPYDADIHKTNIDVTGFILIILIFALQLSY